MDVPKLYRNKTKTRNNNDANSSDDLNSSTESDNVGVTKSRREILMNLLKEKRRSTAKYDSEITTNDIEQFPNKKKHGK